MFFILKNSRISSLGGRRSPLLRVATVIALSLPAILQAQPQIAFIEHPVNYPSSPTGIASGPDGALWFTEAADKIGRITTAGVVTEYALPASASPLYPYRITAGPDGAMWFTERYGNRIGRITTSGMIG